MLVPISILMILGIAMVVAGWIEAWYWLIVGGLSVCGCAIALYFLLRDASVG